MDSSWLARENLPKTEQTKTKLGVVAHSYNLGLERQRQENGHKFETSLVYIASSWMARTK